MTRVSCGGIGAAAGLAPGSAGVPGLLLHPLWGCLGYAGLEQVTLALFPFSSFCLFTRVSWIDELILAELEHFGV